MKSKTSQLKFRLRKKYHDRVSSSSLFLLVLIILLGEILVVRLRRLVSALIIHMNHTGLGLFTSNWWQHKPSPIVGRRLLLVCNTRRHVNHSQIAIEPRWLSTANGKNNHLNNHLIKIIINQTLGFLSFFQRQSMRTFKVCWMTLYQWRPCYLRFISTDH